MNEASLTAVVRLMQVLTAFASFVLALELRVMLRDGVIEGAWPAATLRSTWGWRARLMTPAVFGAVPVVQGTAAALLLMSAILPRTAPLSTAATAILMFLSWLTAVRVRGTMNGGSDGMLFTVVLGLTLATWPNASDTVHAGGVVYVAAQLLLSYVRAGLVKCRERAWWNGDALRAFLEVPAYAVPHWVPRSQWLLCVASVGVIGFELAAPAAMIDARTCLIYGAVAWCFHLATALCFGLNRFLLAWSAALPSLWFAVQLLHR